MIPVFGLSHWIQRLQFLIIRLFQRFSDNPPANSKKWWELAEKITFVQFSFQNCSEDFKEFKIWYKKALKNPSNENLCFWNFNRRALLNIKDLTVLFFLNKSRLSTVNRFTCRISEIRMGGLRCSLVKPTPCCYNYSESTICPVSVFL